MLKLLLLTVVQLVSVFGDYPFKTNQNQLQFDQENTKSYRLNEPTVPLHYDIEITSHLNDGNGFQKRQFTFDAITKILIFPTTDDCNSVKLHAKWLNIDEISLMKDELIIGTEPVQIDVNYTYDNTSEILNLVFGQKLNQNETYKLEFLYSGFMNDDMYGFYRSSYIENGKIEWLGTTHMEPTNARRVFPNFDEPQYKATFSLTLNVPKEYNAISNTRAESVRIPYQNDYVTYKFKKTPKMSSYLLAFVVSKFVKRTDTGTNDDNYKMAIWSRPEQYDRTKYALEKGLQIQNELNQFLGINYDSMDGIEKMDMVALPDFSSGAMENWGLITYREYLLLYDEDLTTDLIKKNVAGVNTHEQAHQWFGNLVTCDWWGNTWLNEAFANYFEYFTTALVEDKWELEKQFVVDNIHRAFVFDSQDGTHPLSHSVESPTESKAMFNLISYQKGGTILRMIELFVGSANFKQALNNYLNDYAYSNGTPEKLLKAFQDSISPDKGDIVKIFLPWIVQPGYPLITVKMDYSNKKANITQRHYHLKNKNNNLKWPVPLTFSTEKFENLKPAYILDSSISHMVIEIDAPKWVIFNVQQSGYYRVQYDEVTWNRISEALRAENHDGIHELNRAQIVDDIFNFARSNDMAYNQVFSILEYLLNENNFLPWSAAFNGFTFLSSRMDSDDLRLIRDYVSRLIQPVFMRLQFTEQSTDTQLDRYLRGKVIEWACKIGNVDCLQETKSLFGRYKNESDVYRIPVNIRGPVLCSVIRNSGMEDYQFLWNKYLTEQASSEQSLILTALGCSNSPDVLQQHLNNIFTEKVRRQDQKTAFQSTYIQTEENLPIVLNYVLEHHQHIVNSLQQKSEIIGLISNLADRFTKESQIEQLETFLVDNTDDYGVYANEIAGIISRAEENMVWNRQNFGVIREYLNSSTVQKSVHVFLLFFGILLVHLFKK